MATKIRIGVVISALWTILMWTNLAQSRNFDESEFMRMAVLPLVVIWGIAWIANGRKGAK